MVDSSYYWFSQGGDPLEPYYAQTEDAYGIPRGTLKGLVAAENTAPGVTSSAGAQTQFQILPSTAADLGVNLSDPHSAMQGAAKYWKQQLDAFGDPGLAYAAYNFGPGNVQSYLRMKKPFPAGVQQYAKTGLSHSKLGSDYVSPTEQQPVELVAPTPVPVPVSAKAELPPLPAPPAPAKEEKKSNNPALSLMLTSLGLLSGKPINLSDVLGGLSQKWGDPNA